MVRQWNLKPAVCEKCGAKPHVKLLTRGFVMTFGKSFIAEAKKHPMPMTQVKNLYDCYNDWGWPHGC